MNSFEQFTIIIGLLAALLEGIAYLREFARKILHSGSKHTG
ncbi:hypothetical protein [Mucilaginibacter sp. 5C4]|nr:hypothetical protein [Mucilaginibacter sp. 5C4]MEB0280463.1 hypothetical protein [Mucilaginibacter sp. 10B2]MEB0300427.1 hypothetical protein [Mucilaginibacter sp. 5C4]WPX23138.1 hypothetical protein RHM67_17805 [Mucilaginibacter sp. 5C4]